MYKENATSGFFEEIILFAVVSILFVSSITFAAYYSAMKATEYQKEELVNEVYNFVMKVMGYQPLIHNGVEGLFDYHKIKSVTMEDLKKDLTPNFKFSMTIEDVSDYYHYSKKWGNISNSYGYYRVVVIYPVDIWVSDHEIHAAKLEVVAWR
ncbi:MAG: hypothetical protein GXO25_01425 [Euryarchaeota archaeon]|nr:hypothetical protein [Euryarchaeota archaeon]